MFKKYIFVFSVCTIILVTGCTSPGTPASIPPSNSPSVTASSIIRAIDVKTAYEMIASNQGNPNFVIIDVRTQSEFASGHIAAAIMIDFYQANFKARIGELDRNRKYLVYCRTANRSAGAVSIMKDLGFREVYDMSGGITQWTAAGYPVVTG